MMDFIKEYNAIRREHTYDTSNDIGFFRLPSFSETGMVEHGFSSRTGGVSGGDYASLNLSFNRDGDSRENVLENFRRFAVAAGLSWECMVMDAFEHGATVLAVDKSHSGAGYIAPPLPYCDGLVTDCADIALITGHADCLPLYFLDPQRRTIGLAHAGYPGTLKQIGRNVIRMMTDTYGCEPNHILAGIGPCICGKCYEVSAELRDEFFAKFPGIPFYMEGKPGKAYIDLAMITAAQFLDEGILSGHITLMDVCTFENEERLYSYRRDRSRAGGMAAYLKLIHTS